MSTSVNLTIDAADADLSFREPDAVTVSQHVSPNTQVSIQIGNYANQGNVPQSVSFAGLTDETNCTYVNAKWDLPGGGLQTMGTDTFVLQPGTQALLTIDVITADEPIGTKGVTAGFTVNVNHVQA